MVDSLQDHDVKQHLMATNEIFSRLATEHQKYKEALHALAGKPFLSDQEQLEEVRIKKLKLHLKDEMEQMLQQYRRQGLSV
jgi:uncharacterized protein YdcH (DUF465 family)